MGKLTYINSRAFMEEAVFRQEDKSVKRTKIQLSTQGYVGDFIKLEKKLQMRKVVPNGFPRKIFRLS